MGTTPSIRVQGYTVRCSEGHRLTGERTAGYQALRCPTCGEGVFVLPRSPLPEPAEATPAAERTQTRAAAAVSPWAAEATRARGASPDLQNEPNPEDDALDGEVQWDDEVAAESGPRSSSPQHAPEDLAAAEMAQAPLKDRSSKTRPRKPAPAEPKTKPTEAIVIPRVPLRERLRRNRNALIFLGVATIVAGTVGFRVWRAGLQELPAIAERGRSEGLPALDAGEFDRANQILSAAKRAVSRLGNEYQGASTIVQAADEAAIIVSLGPRLEDILDEAARADPQEWSKRFDTLYKGRSVIVDAHFMKVPTASGEGRYELDYRIFRDGEGSDPQSVGQIDAAGFKLFELLRPRKDDAIRFGARLASFRFDDATRTWRLGLVPDSGVIMTHEKALEALGWPSDSTDTEGRP